MRGGALRGLVDRLQMAESGSAELDLLVDAALRGASPWLTYPLDTCESGRVTRWSHDLSGALMLLPADYNFSLGQRDGICWAWIQPNDDWQPADLESRHDHPSGSGLIVAGTAALALTSAALMLYANHLDQRPTFRFGLLT